jgi:hypothetical protein
MKKADNFDAGKWLVENKLTFQSQLNEEETLTPAQRAALTRAKNKKEDEEMKLRFRAADKARQEEEQNRRANNKLPLVINTYRYGYKTEQYLGDLAQYYTEHSSMEGPGSDGSTNLKLKPEFVDQSFDNAQVAWNVYDNKVNK